ncbi:biotin--[acetyl-CoA-carboxylase] ligase [Clostridium gasigenes]|uniref:biotin--[acetyl-CoA-carboxylase] ligase n=1 Tax=Clostridium gasigenes TaxID=94869 RepID=UPI001438461C|nr:biotin--[acetyl-CoA-carboxylase] ligase [Clostridium gasigenes]MBU3132025.1 biotin--[acetyl-CoA-carboxylase] ligase [Clostridium gasigenes]NKF07054.1 biotin--[acetyl-CoA-carboxylase] ligase [Clostridium gasigenes]QSW19692.1 biotin--[acetyl-CoA-carboxylase] ligase [Clostridium gasigenes]
MKEKILNLLKSNKNYISGEEISKLIGITRSSVWKYINMLKKDGYIIDGVSNKGYKLICEADLISLNEIKSNLTTTFMGKELHYFKEVTSTNSTAKDLAIKDAPNGTLVISEIQTSGKGRLGRVWTSPKGGIWASLILRPDIEPINCPKITLIAAAAEAITLESYNLKPEIKWPNDLLLKNKKFSGILTEMSCDMDRVNYIILGFGINVNLSKEDIPNDLLDKATSLSIEYGCNLNRTELLCNYLQNFETLYNEFIFNNSIDKTIDICRKNSMLIGKKIVITSRDMDENVFCIDIAPSGELLVRDSLGKERLIFSGEASLSKNY